MVWDDDSFLERELKKLKIVLRRSVYDDILDKIVKANRNLRRFTHQSRSLETIRCKRRSVRSTAVFKTIRRHATSLHRVILDERSWKCKCRNHHAASLRLETRSTTSSISISTFRFRMLLSRYQTGKEAEKNVDWREIDVEAAELEITPNQSQ